MRLSDKYILQMIEDNHYVLVDDVGQEMEFDSEVLARLAIAGVGYFASVDPTLAAACVLVRVNNPTLPPLPTLVVDRERAGDV